MAPLYSFDKVTTDATATTTNEFTLPLEIKPRLDLWSTSACYSWPTKQQKRQVRFGAIQEVNHIHINDFTGDEVQACWYGSRDYDEFRIDNDATIRMIENNERQQEQEFILEDDSRCTAGLEMMTARASFLSRRRIQEAVMAVLDAQNEQCFHGLYDPDHIAVIYNSCSSRCKEIARCRAEHDALTINNGFLSPMVAC